MRLSKLPAAVKGRVNAGELTAGHARALLSVKDPETLARRIVAQGLTVRDVERVAQRESEPAPEMKTARSQRLEKDADTRALERALSDVTGLVVSIDHSPRGGAMTIRYKTLEQLDALCRRLQR
jgi:ParB family chromosome partitioning protein